jgi:Domain of unknown function (DUF5659)
MTEQHLLEKHDDGDGHNRKLTDISLVTYLNCKGFKIKRIRKLGDQSFFYFEESKELDEEMLRFFNHEGLVDPLYFAEMLRNLKGLAKQA